MVFIASAWTAASSKSVKVFSNCDSVSLSLNGTLVATQAPDKGGNVSSLEHPPFTFTVPAFQTGTLRADAKIGGVIKATYLVTTPGNPKSITVAIDTANLQFASDGSDIAIVYASILDSLGTVIPSASNAVTFSVSGNATLIGQNPMPAQAGIATIFLQAGTSPGSITVTAAATGLPNGTAIVTSHAAYSTTGVSFSARNAGHAALPETFSLTRYGQLLMVTLSPSVARQQVARAFALSDVRGKVVARWRLTAARSAMALRSLAHGTYLGRMEDEPEGIVRKIVW